MIFRGQFKNGVVVFDEPPPLADGAAVEVAPIETPVTAVGISAEQPSWLDVFKDFIGQARGLPSDMARNHDHYIHGARKR